MLDSYTILETIYPMVYGTTETSSEIADQIYEHLLQYLSDQASIFQKQKQREGLKAELPKSLKELKKFTKNQKGQDSIQYGTYVKFMCQYGCALLITKQKMQSPISVTIVFPQQWSSGSNTYKKQELYFCEPKSMASIYTAQLSQHQKSINQFIYDFSEKLAKIISKQKYTIKEVQIAVRQSIVKFKNYHNESDQQMILQPKRKDQQVKTFAEMNIDFNECKANTAWYVIQAIIKKSTFNRRRRLQSRIRCEKLIVGFKVWILNKVINENLSKEQNQQQSFVIQRKDIIKYKKCLNEAIFYYKSINSSNSQTNTSFVQKIRQINDSIYSMNGYKLTTQIEQVDEQQQIKAQFQEKLLINKPKPYFKVIKQNKQAWASIQQFCYEVNPRFPFQDLLCMYNQNINKQSIKKNQQQKQSFLNHWVLLVQKTIFQIAYQISQLDKKNPIIDLDINIREIKCQFGAPSICKLVIKYEQVLQINKVHYGMGLQAQAFSHIQLVKTICSVISFECVKIDRKNMKSNLDSYVIPLKINKLYKFFISHDYLARRAMKCMNQYQQKRINHKPIFKLDGTCNSFYEFGLLVFSESRKAQGWLAYMQNIQKVQAKLPIKAIFPKNQNEQKLIAFLHNIPSDVLGLIKMCMLAQNPNQNTKMDKKQLQKNVFGLLNSIQNFQKQQLKITIYGKKIDNQHQDLRELKLLFKECQKGEQLKLSLFECYQNYNKKTNNKQINKNSPYYYQLQLKNFIKPPNDSNMIRQHEAYASKNLIHKGIQIQQFMAFCTTRAAQQTQILVLCTNLIQKKIIVNCYDAGHYFEELIFLQSAGQLSSYKQKTEDYFKMVKKLLDTCVSTWIYAEAKFCPIYGPFIAYLVQQYLDNVKVERNQAKKLKKVSLNLARRCWEQFTRGKSQLQQNPSLNIEWDQRFIIVATMCCFRQLRLSQFDSEQIQFLTQLIFQLRIAKIFSDRQKKQDNKRDFHIQRAYSIQKVIFSNIQAISNFLVSNTHLLNKVLKNMDKDFPNSIQWEKVSIYEFKGTSKQKNNKYQIDLYRGCMYKNGKQLSALDQKIRKHPNFVKIFGSNRDFQVFQDSTKSYLRTKNNFCQQFKADQQKYQIFFQFSEDGNQIRHIIKRNYLQEEQVWELVPRQIITKSRIHFPALFVQDYLAWYCESKKCMVFRKTQYQNIYDIGLVIHLDYNSETDFIIKKVFYITYHSGFEKQNLDQICNINNTTYQQIILRQKNNNKSLKDIRAFQLLQKLDEPKFVFQLKNKKTNQIYYFLHRYQLKFKFKQGRLLSQSHFGYYVDTSCKQTQGNIYQQLIPCLILKKDTTNQMVLNAHNRILIVSDGKVKQDAQILKSKKANQKIRSFKYQIHDFFGDIRGSTRQSQFQMVALLISVEDNLKIAGIQMTPLQYAIHIFKTCFTNRPLTQTETYKLKNILQLVNSQIVQSFQLLLLCQILWKGSHLLNKILPFDNQNKNTKLIQHLSGSLLISRTLYETNIQNQKLSFRKKIEPAMLKFIGLNIREAINISAYDKNSDTDIRQFWIGLQEQKGNIIEQNFKEIFQKYKQVSFAKQFSFQQIEIIEQNKKQLLKFPENIQKMALFQSNSLMLQEMIKQIKLSHQSFAKQQKRLQRFVKQFSGQNKQKRISLLSKSKNDATQCIKTIQNIIQKLKQNSQNHPDIISGFRPSLSYAFFTQILCYQNQIYHYFPQMPQKTADKLKYLIKIWMDLQTRKASFERIIILVKDEKFDIIALLRQIQSPRQQIFGHKQWICFEAEMKIQIWPSQMETYNNLMNNIDRKPFCQLNMGEGKTQVIIPMMILKSVFDQKSAIPRINLLSSLYEQTRVNMFKFLSATGFQIPCFQLPFNREVQLEKRNIFKIRNLMDCFSKKAFILVKRQSRLSQILRYNQIAIDKQKIKQTPLFNCQIFDIFDEVDALMTPKKSYIYSVGQKFQLPSSKIRFQILRELIQKLLCNCVKELFCQKMITSNQTQEKTYQLIEQGEYPDGLRIIFENIPSQKIDKWKRNIVLAVLSDKQNHYYSFIQKLDRQQLNKLVEYCVNPHTKYEIISKKISPAALDQIYILRGALAFGIFQHCLSKRCGVDYGVPGPDHPKKIAVPYEAADIPSKTSQFEHPEVSILLSYLSYYHKGLTVQQFFICLRTLLNLNSTYRKVQYQKWLQILNQQQKKTITIVVEDININSKTGQANLYNIFKKNRKTIAFYLISYIFPKDLKQYKYNICSSSFDLANVPKSIGFSGTMDNHWILPNTIKLIPCQTPTIRGTDGKMINLVTKYTKQVSVIVQDNIMPLWQRFIGLALVKKAGCLLDVGALCVGKDLKNEIVPWIANNQHFNSQKFAGISFCDQNGKWQVYDIQTQSYINRGTTIPDHQTFVVFDEARTRGADLKMETNVMAALSLGPDLTKDKLMQAAGRLRKLGRNQTLIILTTHQVLSTLPGFPKELHLIDKKLSQKTTQQMVQLILAWSCKNSISESENLLSQYSTLGWKHVYSQVNNEVFKQQILPKLQQRYKNSIEIKTIAEMNEKIVSKRQEKQLQHQTGKHLCQIIQKYGKNVKKFTKDLDDICERQIEVQKQIQKQIQIIDFKQLNPIPQQDPPRLENIIKAMHYKFPKQFFMTSNFLNTTHLKQEKDKQINFEQTQLPEGYFIKYNPNSLAMISLREASQFIKINILNKNLQKQNFKLALLNEMSIDNQEIKKYGLQQSLVCAKFVAGYENYNEEEQNILTKILMKTLTESYQNIDQRKMEYQNVTSAILRKKKLYFKKFTGSSLQKIIIRLCNQEIPFQQKINKT